MHSRTWWIIGLALGLAACGDDSPAPAPTFRPGPPAGARSLAVPATASVGVLTGSVWVADTSQPDPKTQKPQGYRLYLGAGGTVAVQALSRRWQAVIASGSYRIAGLPVGATLLVTASAPGYVSRTQQATIPPAGEGHLSFMSEEGWPDSELLPPPLLQGLD